MPYLSKLKPKDIFLDIKAKDKKDIIYQMARSSDIRNKKEVFEALIAREGLGTTAIGKGIALPHVKTKLVKKIIIKFALFREGADFDALDGKKVNFVFLIIAPYTDSAEYLRVLSRIARFLDRPDARKALLKAGTKQAVLRALKL